MTDPATTDPDSLIAILSVGASIVSAIAASIAAIGIWRGIGAMVSANRDRAAQATADRKATVAADERRHAEAMAALNELIRAGQRQGAALERQGEALGRQGEALERQGAALERQGAALETLIERTAPPAR